MSLVWIMLEALTWHFALIACGILYTLIFTYVMYFRALGQVIEERKHQRQMELLAMQMEMEQRRHGSVTDDAGGDPLGIGGDVPAGAGPDETEGAADG